MLPFFQCCLVCVCFYQFLLLYSLFLLALISIQLASKLSWLAHICYFLNSCAKGMLCLSDSGCSDIWYKYHCQLDFFLYNVVPSFPVRVLWTTVLGKLMLCKKKQKTKLSQTLLLDEWCSLVPYI